MSKKIVAMLMAVAMAFSLLPVTAFATGETPDTTTKDVVDGHYNDEGNWESGKPANAIPDSLKDTVTTVDKTAKKVADNQYEVTLKVEMKHRETAVLPGAAATVLVIDKSGSMSDNNRLSAAKTAAINFLKSYSGFSDSNFDKDGNLKKKVSDKNLKRYVSLVTFNDSASVQEWGNWNNKESWIDVSTKDGYNKLVEAINKIPATGGTNLDAALRLAKAQMQSDSIKQIEPSTKNVIALTDGVPTYYVKETRWGTGNVSQHKSYGCPDTNVATTRSADVLKANVNAVYTVCFGAANDKCWTEDSVHTLIPYKTHATDGPTVGNFLKENIATQPADGSNKKYAYNANDADGLYKAFAAITQTITDGLNEGVVTDGLPTGVTAVKDSGFTERWELKSNEATVSKDGEYNVYTYTKTYKVNVDPAAVSTVKVGEVNYAPLNTPTILTVQHNGSPVQIPFPIPAGKVTYSLTNFKKELVTEEDNFSNPPAGVTIPENATSTVTVGENGVTLLYKITVSGDKGAKFTVIDTGATLVPPTDDSIVFNQTDSTFSGTVGTTGETVFYVSKHFDIDANTKTVSNTATIVPGDNANGPNNKEQNVTTTVTKPAPQTYTVTYRWAEGEKPSDADTLLPQGGTFTVDQKYTVADVPQSSVAINADGKTGIWSCTWDKSGTIEGTANQEIVITGTWTFTENKPTTGNLIVKKVVSGESLTLNDLPTGSKEFKITVSGNGESKELSLKDSGVNVNESKTEATWTISSLPADEYTVSESNADVTGYDCTATYNATNGATVIVNSGASAVQNQPATDAQASQKVTVTENQTSTMTVTNKYKKQEVEPTPDTSKPDVNKTATDLVNDKTDVTLSVGGKSAKENVAVMFLLDKSTSQGIRDEAANMLDELATKTNTNILYDVVIFSGTASSSGWQDIQDSTTLDAIKDNFVGSNPTDGTNMSAGILKAKSDIASLKNTHKEYTETYLITLSDGITYVWSEVDQGKVYCIPVSATGNSDSESSTQNAVDTWDMMYDYGKSLEEVYGGVPQFLSAIQSKITQTKNDSHVQEYPSLENPIDTYIYNAEKTKETTDKYACGPEAAMYYSITGYEQLATEFTKTFAYALPELNKKTGEDNVTNWTRFPWGREVMEYCKSISFNKTWDGNVSNTNPGKIFSGIKNVIYYEIQSGSITDVIGADFSLTDQTLTKDTFTLTVNGKTVAANDPTDNVVTFGEANEAGQYPYVLTYYKGKAAKNEGNTCTITSGSTTYTYTPCDTASEVNGSVSDEFFVLEMNVPVVSLDLKYNLSLTSKRTAAGTYEVPTNESATLAYQSANQSSGTVDFNEPTVSYTVKGSSGSHSGGSRPSLNTKDHYGYIIGYPVDYYTGQPTTDQTKKPVRPEGKITRAEVATIYFRMLTDESRTKFWSQSNSYSDVKAGDWFNNAVSTLSKAGIIAGYEDGSFKPNGYITRAEFATIAARFFDVTYNGKDLFPDISGHWAKDYINQAANKGFVNGYEDGTFKPDRNITRAEAVTLVNRTLDRHPDKNHFTKDMLVWPDNMDQTKWYYADMQEATNSHTYQMKENSDKTKYENWTKTLPIRNWEALEKAWSNANSSQGNGNVV